jgi:2-dehydro-3-deoxygluconokinase
VAWVSRVGGDPLGTLPRTRVAGYGVDVSMVDIDPAAPAGVFFKDPGPQTKVYYYRGGSTASRLGPELFDRTAFADCHLIHLTGVTPAPPASCAELVTRARDSRPISGAVHSFDVNYRPALWSRTRPAPRWRGWPTRPTSPRADCG